MSNSLRRLAFLIVLVALGTGALPAQPKTDGPGLAQETAPKNPTAARSSIRAFRGLRLGMSLDEVKSRLAQDPFFNYRGDPDVYFLPAKEQLLIECDGNVFIRRAYFQFVDKRLFSLILDLDASRVDYFTMLTALAEAYGAYAAFSPQAVVWEKEGVRLALEKPLTVKYIDLAVFNRLKEAGRAQTTEREQTLKEFLQEF